MMKNQELILLHVTINIYIYSYCRHFSWLLFNWVEISEAV